MPKGDVQIAVESAHISWKLFIKDFDKSYNIIFKNHKEQILCNLILQDF